MASSAPSYETVGVRVEAMKWLSITGIVLDERGAKSR
jgi:hypothetical protein